MRKMLEIMGVIYNFVFAGDGLYPSFDFAIESDMRKFKGYIGQFDYEPTLKSKIETIVNLFKKRGKLSNLLTFLLLSMLLSFNDRFIFRY